MEPRKIEVQDDSEIQFAKNVLKSLGYTSITVVQENGKQYVVGKMAAAAGGSDLEASHSGWRVAGSLLKLISQVNDIAPKRKKASDGTIADQNHPTTSDHQPKIKDGGQGVVTAADITHDPTRGCDCNLIASSMEKSRDERIKYVIWNRRIMNSQVSPWTWRAYNGSNPHDKHIHVSVRSEKKYYDGSADWDLGDMRKAHALSAAAGAKIAWGAHVDAAFKDKVIGISAGLGVDPSDLMAVMAFESARTFSPSVKNEISGAVGLIQFMPKTAKSLGTSSSALAAMTAVQQLDFVEKYFKSFSAKLNGIYDLYACVLWPRAIGKEKSYVLFSTTQNKKAYKANKGLDANDDGAVTKAEAASKVISHLEEGMRETNLG